MMTSGKAEAELQKRKEKTVLRIEKKIGLALFRYIVAERREEKGKGDGRVYSVYVEYESEGTQTCNFVSSISCDRERAFAFCHDMANNLVTPLSLPFIYEDSLTP